MKLKALGLVLLIALGGAACTRSVQPRDDSDSAVLARVEFELRGRKDVDIRYLSIDILNGLVTLTGIVPSPDQILLIERIVKRTPGVEQVMNNIIAQE